MRPLRSLSAGVIMTVSLTTHLASAGKRSAAPAPAAVVEARRLMAAGNYAEACPKLADAESQTPAPLTAITLAICYEKAGKIASASAAYKVAADVATSAHKATTANVAKRGATRLDGQVSHLTIRLTGARTSDVEVRRDGDVVPDSDIGVPVPLDGGGHDVEVSASGKKSRKAHVDLATSGQNATVDVPALEDATPAPAAAVAPAPPAEEASAASPGQAQRVSGVAVAALGVIGVVLGSVAGLEANAKYHDALSACGGSTSCPPGSEGPSLRSSAGTWATVSTAAFIAGGVGLAGGAVLWFTAPNGHGATTTVGLGPAERGTGLSLVGRF